MHYTRFISSATTPSIVFFQSLLSSRLQSQKIRKFQQFFPDFAPFAKKNQRLKEALAIVHTQLTENNQDVSYFNLSNERRLSENLHLTAKKSFCQQPNNHSQSSNALSAQQPVKRRPGRPRKYNIIPDPTPASVPNSEQKNQLAECPEQIIKKITEKTTEKDPLLEKQQQPVEKINKKEFLQQKQEKKKQRNAKIQQKENQNIQDDNCEKVVRKKIICKDLQKAKRLIQRSFYREAFNLLSHFKIDSSNILDFLDLQIIPSLEDKLNSRSLLKLKERAKKALVDRYFNRKTHERSLQQRCKSSIRGKVIRRLLSFFRQHDPTYCKKLALAWEESIQLKSQEKEHYMQSFVQLFNNVKVCGFLEAAKMTQHKTQ